MIGIAEIPLWYSNFQQFWVFNISYLQLKEKLVFMPKVSQIPHWLSKSLQEYRDNFRGVSWISGIYLLFLYSVVASLAICLQPLVYYCCGHICKILIFQLQTFQGHHISMLCPYYSALRDSVWSSERGGFFIFLFGLVS